MYLQVKSFSLISVHVKSLSLLSKVCTGIGPKFYIFFHFFVLIVLFVYIVHCKVGPKEK